LGVKNPLQRVNGHAETDVENKKVKKLLWVMCRELIFYQVVKLFFLDVR
jgi:hypothetical protein